jgi:hypothetical protein
MYDINISRNMKHFIINEYLENNKMFPYGTTFYRLDSDVLMKDHLYGPYI